MRVGETGGAKSDRRDGGVFKSLDYDKLVKSDDADDLGFKAPWNLENSFIQKW